MVSFILREDFFIQFSSLYKEQAIALKTPHDFTDNVIQERQQKILSQDNENHGNRYDALGEKRKITFLDILLQAKIDGKPLSDLDIREEVDTFMFEVR